MSKARDLADFVSAGNPLADGTISASEVSGLGTAATTASTDYATAAQGALADSAVQPADLGTAAYTNSTAYATAAQGSLADSAVQPNDSPNFGTVNVTSIDFGAWTITESAGVLYFASNGTNKLKIDASGNLTVSGNVTAYGSV